MRDVSYHEGDAEHLKPWNISSRLLRAAVDVFIFFIFQNTVYSRLT